MGVRSMVKVKCRNLLLRDKTREQLLTGFNTAYFGQSLTTVYGRFYTLSEKNGNGFGTNSGNSLSAGSHKCSGNSSDTTSLIAIVFLENLTR